MFLDYGSLISLGALDTLGCEYSAKQGGFIEARRSALVAMKGEKVRNLYMLIRKTIVGRAMKVEPTYEGKAWMKRKLGSCVKYDESLNSTYDYSC